MTSGNNREKKIHAVKFSIMNIVKSDDINDLCWLLWNDDIYQIRHVDNSIHGLSLWIICTFYDKLKKLQVQLRYNVISLSNKRPLNDAESIVDEWNLWFLRSLGCVGCDVWKVWAARVESSSCTRWETWCGDFIEWVSERRLRR